MDFAGECCARAELAAVFCMNGADGGPTERIATENAAFARRVYNLIRWIFGVQPEIIVKKNHRRKTRASYYVRFDADALANAGAAGPGCLQKFVKKKCCKKAALRGAFLAGGSVADPEKLYHLEIYCKKVEHANFFYEIMAYFNLNPKVTERTDYNVVYLKDSERIADFLNATGAHRALLSLENTRILKGVRNSVNRAVNCETANLEKTVNASLRQNANIAYINEMIGFDALPENLREIAALRSGNREISLRELGLLLSPPLGKSGVNHRLRKLDAIAEQIRENKRDA